MKEIPLHGKYGEGKYALVDDEDYESINKLKWYADIGGYAVGYKNKSTVRMHRLIMNPPDDMQIDHINHNKLDNTKVNLRIVTNQQNHFNFPKPKGTSSIYKGVYWSKDKNRWVSKIVIDDKQIHIGYFDIEEDAACAYNDYAIRLFGEYASLNSVKSNELWSQNKRNRTKNSKYIGVSYIESKQLWMAYTSVNGKVKNIGTFNSEHYAAVAYNGYVIENNLDRELNDVNYNEDWEKAKRSKSKTSKYDGVTKFKNRDRWRADISFNRECVYIGSFPTEVDAALAYNEYIIKNNINKELNIIHTNEIKI